MGIWPDLEKIKSALGEQALLTRYAPSPTGYLHMGHVVNALYVWGIAKALDGKVVLRLENHDRTRCRPEYEDALLTDLEWLGLRPDIGEIAMLRAAACDYRQSDCGVHYAAALAQLHARGLVYACDCSRKRIQARTGQADAEELRYDGHCRTRGLLDAPGMTLRVILPDREVFFEDMLLGPQRQHPLLEIGDVAIRDNHGHWTYQFAVVVDDIRQHISMVIRGLDILSSTGRQILLAELLGNTQQPVYLHHPLLTDSMGRKLSKRDFDADIHQLMQDGASAAQVLGEAARLVGFTQKFAPLTFGEITEMFKTVV